ncbi:MAG: hypothetical protein Q612_NSC00034G0001, partial [Negativicoccus succinicivorans DORA_17_25]
ISSISTNPSSVKTNVPSTKQPFLVILHFTFLYVEEFFNLFLKDFSF